MSLLGCWKLLELELGLKVCTRCLLRSWSMTMRETCSNSRGRVYRLAEYSAGTIIYHTLHGKRLLQHTVQLLMCCTYIVTHHFITAMKCLGMRQILLQHRLESSSVFAFGGWVRLCLNSN